MSEWANSQPWFFVVSLELLAIYQDPFSLNISVPVELCRKYIGNLIYYLKCFCICVHILDFLKLFVCKILILFQFASSPVHLFFGIDPLVGNPLVPVEDRTAHVGHPAVRLVVGLPRVPVQQGASLRLHTHHHLYIRMEWFLREKKVNAISKIALRNIVF